jgi:hypothetical protein
MHRNHPCVTTLTLHQEKWRNSRRMDRSQPQLCNYVSYVTKSSFRGEVSRRKKGRKEGEVNCLTGNNCVRAPTTAGQEKKAWTSWVKKPGSEIERKLPGHSIPQVCSRLVIYTP